MKKTITYILFLLFTLFGFSQNRIVLHGRVLWQDNPINNVDVINFTTKKIAVTNETGDFYIDAKVSDQLILISKDFIDQKLTLSQSDFNNTLITIKLEEKPIELDEVKIRAQEKFVNIATYEDLNAIKIAKENSGLKPIGVYTGELTNSTDFVQIGRMIAKGIGKLFKGNKEKTKKKMKNIDFQEYAKSNFSEEFYTKTLELKPEEIALFLNFCEADSKSKEIIESEDEFTIMDFLVSKKEAFLKIISENKK
jgi:hypothetical protein